MLPTTPVISIMSFTDEQNSFLNERFQALNRGEIVFRALTYSPSMIDLLRNQNMRNVLNQLQNGNYVHFDSSFYFGKYNDMIFIFTINENSTMRLYLMSFLDDVDE